MFPNYYAQDPTEPVEDDDIQTENEEDSQDEEEAGEDFEEKDEPEDMTGPSKKS